MSWDALGSHPAEHKFTLPVGGEVVSEFVNPKLPVVPGSPNQSCVIGMFPVVIEDDQDSRELASK